ncbi:MAG: DUF3553 domain-containing protein [Acidobacteriota bacterium]|nr:DUF3553 domain-containing protein [Acidobacteriota bacterium]
MTFSVGDRVAHPARPEWGPGEILAVSGESKFTVYFALIGPKLLKNVALVRLTGPESSHPLLENRVRSGKRGAKTRSVLQLKESFLRRFPGGFEDGKYVKNERAYKVAASELLKKTMASEELSLLRSAGDHAEVCRRALAVISRTNLVLPSERMDLSNGLTGEGYALFSRALADLLYGSSSSQDRFERFWKMLQGIGAPKWTIATYFRFLAEPETEMFLKPEATKAAAASCGFELNYRPDLNWQTYERLLAFSALLKEAIADLRPRDMIDVQGFIWKTRPRE